MHFPIILFYPFLMHLLLILINPSWPSINSFFDCFNQWFTYLAMSFTFCSCFRCYHFGRELPFKYELFMRMGLLWVFISSSKNCLAPKMRIHSLWRVQWRSQLLTPNLDMLRSILIGFLILYLVLPSIQITTQTVRPWLLSQSSSKLTVAGTMLCS